MEYYLKKQLLIMSCLYIGQILVGFGFGWSTPMVPILQDPELTPLPHPATSGQTSLILPLFYVGTILGPFVSVHLSNIKGRKPCLLLGGVLKILAFLLLGLSSNVAMVFAGRIFTGLGSGIIFVLSLVYIGEIASTNIRGILLTGTGLFSTLGALLVYSVGPYVEYSVTSYLGLAISAVYVAGLFMIPESPIFHILKGKEDEAKAVLISLGRDDDIDSDIFTKPDDSIYNGQWKDLFKRRNLKALYITLTLNILQQSSGIFVVIIYATTIFKLAGSSIDPNVATILIGVTQLIASSIAPMFVDRTGRRVLLLASTLLCGISLAVLGIYFFIYRHSTLHSVHWLPLLTLIILFLSYDMGFGIIPGTLLGEMFAPHLRSTGATVVIITSWLFGSCLTTAYGYLITPSGGHRVHSFWLFSLSCLVAFVFTVLYVPETKGKSFREIQEMLRK